MAISEPLSLPTLLPAAPPGPDGVLAVAIANDAARRARGLMDLERMPAREAPPGVVAARVDGMLFLYGERQPAGDGVWNVRTLMPLDVSFIYWDADANTNANENANADATGKGRGVLRIFQVSPMRSILETGGLVEVYRAQAPFIAALETVRGRLERAGFGPGTLVQMGGITSGASASIRLFRA